MEPIKVAIKIKSGFAIGSGLGLAGILDDTIMRDVRGLPYIPGTTLKGVIRDACEEISLIADYPCYENVVDELKNLATLTGGRPDPEQMSLVTRIFGSPLFSAIFEFGSAYLDPSDDSITSLIGASAVWSESHNSIEQSTGTAKKDYLFTHEVALSTSNAQDIPDYHFDFSITPLANPILDKDKDKNKLVGLLMCGLRFIDRIGAKKTRGKGVVEMCPDMPYEKKELDQWIKCFLEGDK